MHLKFGFALLPLTGCCSPHVGRRAPRRAGMGFRNYQGLHMDLSRRFGNLLFQASYRFAKDLGSLGTVGLPNMSAEVSARAMTDRFNPRYDRGNLPGVRRNRFLLTALAPLPFGKGHAIGSGWGPIRNLLLGGWELSAVALAESGTFETPLCLEAGINRIPMLCFEAFRRGRIWFQAFP
jgi:hypothetical protein